MLCKCAPEINPDLHEGEESNMGSYACTSPTRRLPHGKCVCSAISVAAVVVILLLVNLVTLSRPLPLNRSISNRFEAISNPRLLLKEFPTAFSPRLRSTGVRLLKEKNGVNNKVDFTDAQFIETVEQQYNKIISSQKWLRQRVVWEEHGLQKAPEIKFETSSKDLTVTLFSAPRAFSGSGNDRNRQALLSWLHLSPRPHVVLLGNHSSLHAMAEEFSGLVSVEPNIDYSFTGVPLFHSMVARANAVDTNVTVLVHPTAVLLQDFMPGLRKLAGTFTEWALVSQRLETSDLPFRFVHKGGGIVFLEHEVSGDSMIDRELASFVRSSGKLELLEGVSVWAWTVSKDEPLFAPPMPSFTYGAGYHDQWMARGLAKGARTVVDATDALVGFHVRDTHAVIPKATDRGDESTTTMTKTLTWSMASQQWQNIANLYLYRKHRNISAEEKDLLSGGWKLIGCPEPFMIKLCISETHSAANPCRCANIFSRPVSGSRYAETFLEKEARLRLEVIEIPALTTSSTPQQSSFHTLNQLLPQMADAHKNVVLVGTTCVDKDLLWSFMCRAKALGVTNILVAAFDKSVYESALVRGLPVFYAGPTPSEVAHYASPPADAITESSTECAQEGQSSTKWKVHVVLQVLQKGFHVLWSDVDVIWFQNPLPHLTSTHKTGTLVVESDERDVNLPANNGGRVNAGFFYAKTEKATIKTFKELKRRSAADQPEHLLFSQTLCGKRVGVTECTAPSTGLRTRFLDRRTFANGVVNGYWRHQNVTQVALSNGVYALHNNRLHGADEKMSRQKAKLVWFYNDSESMCMHPWQRSYNESSQAGDADTELV